MPIPTRSRLLNGLDELTEPLDDMIMLISEDSDKKANKIKLTTLSDHIAYPSGCSVRLTSNTDLPTNEKTVLAFDDVIYDLNNEYDTEEYSFNPAKAGVYSVNISLAANSTPTWVTGDIVSVSSVTGDLPEPEVCGNVEHTFVATAGTAVTLISTCLVKIVNPLGIKIRVLGIADFGGGGTRAIIRTWNMRSTNLACYSTFQIHKVA